MRRAQTRVVTAGLFVGLVGLAGCPGGGIPGAPGGGGSVDPKSCNWGAAAETGVKIQKFLEATVALDGAIQATEVEITTGCDAMARELGIEVSGGIEERCNAVAAEIRSSLQAGLKAGASLTIDYKPAVCTVSLDAAASAAAECEAHASADVAVTCQGTCDGVCHGECRGSGAAGTGGASGAGSCAGQCEGRCEGSCSGHADVQASAECKAHAEVSASVKADCTPAELTVTYDASVVADAPKVEKVAAAIRAGMPGMLQAYVRLGTLKGAFVGWSRAASDLGKNASGVAKAFKDQAMCVSAQLGAAGKMVGAISSSIDVQVSVSVEVSGSAGASI